MIQSFNVIDEIASRIDIGLCDACGAIRMSEENIDEFHDEDHRDNVRRNEVTAVLIQTVRRDIGNLAGEVRRGFSTLEERVRVLELQDAKDRGAYAGVKGTMGVIVVACTLVGGLIGWLVSLVTRSIK